MRFAICDDEPARRALLRSFFEDRPHDTVDLFEHPRTLLTHIQNKADYDLIFLDIEFPDARGTDLVKEIAEAAPNADIVFVTAHPAYVTEAFRLPVAQYFLKPLEKERFLHELNLLINRRAREKAFWSIKSKDGVYRFLPSDIIYVEAYHRHLKIQTKTGAYDTVGKLSDAEQALYPYWFRRSHQGFLVNLNYVTQIMQDHLVCRPDHQVPVSIRKRTAFLKEYARWMEERPSDTES